MASLNKLVHIIAHGLRVPVLAVKYGSIALSVPETIETAAEFLEHSPALRVTPAPNQLGVAQYLDSPYRESFLYINIEPGIELWVGPFLRKPVREREITQMIRERGLPLGKRQELLAYYSRRQLLDDRQHFYMGKLLQQLCGSAAAATLPDIAPDKPPAPVFSARTSGAQPEQLEHPPYFFELEMVRLITCGDLPGALDTMKRINTFPRAVLADDAVRSLKNSLICNCTFLARAAIAGGAPPDDAFSTSDRLILKIERTQKLSQLEALERDILIDFVSLVDSYNSTHYSGPVRDTIGYINRNLSERLTLGELAEKVGLHPNYLSTLFHREYGRTLSRYILERRIEEASFYLRYTGDPISDISSFYQFSSQSHFIRCFSKVTGMTPLHYRKSVGSDPLTAVQTRQV